MSILEWLQNWYRGSCDGVWEHSYGVRIDTLDNPGWHVRIDLASSPLANAVLERKLEHSDDDWMVCSVQDRQFHGYGDPGKLGLIFEIFREWVEHSVTQSSRLG